MATQIIDISHSADVFEASEAARDLAEEIGFSDRECEEIVLVVRELATNILKHAGSGSITLTPVNDGNRKGLEIEAVDMGPGIPDVERAFADGFSSTNSLGYGLGTVNRLMDELDITSHQGLDHGTRVLCRRWLRQKTLFFGNCPLDFGVITRPYPGMQVNGDAYVIKCWEHYALVGVIDGLGHGQFAHRASQKASSYIETHFDLPLSDIFLGVGRACRGTRGVVMALARVDWKKNKLVLASIGNIEVRVCNASESVRGMIRRGIIGVNAPKPLVTEHTWKPEYILVLHSDGLSTRWKWEDFSQMANISATYLARKLFISLAKDNDDATVVVVKGAAIS